MRGRLRDHVTYANVMATIAVFIALGGSGYAAVTINGSQLKNRSVAGKKLKKDTLTGTQIKESKLGKVPRAKHADSADLATSANNTSNLAGRPASAYAASACPSDMVKVGPTCIDRYEDSVWSKPNGGTQYGVSSADYPCNANGNDCKGRIYARSVPGVTPSRDITWFQAEQALANSGKRLPTNDEWQQAAAGTPDPGASPGTHDCNTSGGITVATGSRANCVSAWGVNDMVGNLSEWVARWVAAPTASPGWGTFSDDRMSLSGASTTEQGPAALIRGGSWGFGASAGVFAVDWSLPSGTDNDIGFRGAR
jgi:Sulfatase-modifying factor enzyme 1